LSLEIDEGDEAKQEIKQENDGSGESINNNRALNSIKTLAAAVLHVR
jgi:hypothetical protein